METSEKDGRSDDCGTREHDVVGGRDQGSIEEVESFL